MRVAGSASKPQAPSESDGQRAVPGRWRWTHGGFGEGREGQGRVGNGRGAFWGNWASWWPAILGSASLAMCKPGLSSTARDELGVSVLSQKI